MHKISHSESFFDVLRRLTLPRNNDTVVLKNGDGLRHPSRFILLQRYREVPVSRFQHAFPVDDQFHGDIDSGVHPQPMQVTCRLRHVGPGGLKLVQKSTKRRIMMNQIREMMWKEPDTVGEVDLAR
jgi:hypothetical protein